MWGIHRRIVHIYDGELGTTMCGLSTRKEVQARKGDVACAACVHRQMGQVWVMGSRLNELREVVKALNELASDVADIATVVPEDF